ncbi:MAG: hypothetical protein AAFX50_02265, partial [Acidobacteriota bacterium]
MTLKTVRSNSPSLRTTGRPGFSVRLADAGRDLRTLAVAVALASAPATAAAQTPEIVPSDGARTVQQLEVGNDLYIALEGMQPHRDYRVLLLDEGLTTVAEETLRSDGDGRARPGDIPLWQRSGIVGCDLSSPADPASFRYRDLGQADAVLGGRTWTLEAHELGTQQTVTSLPISLTSARTRAVYFFTDAAGCPRNEIYDVEALYLYAEGIRPEARDAQVVLVGGGGRPGVGDPLVDARGAGVGPQGIDLEPGDGTFFELVWARPEVGNYGGVIRLGRDTDLFFLADDRWVGRIDADRASLRPNFWRLENAVIRQVDPLNPDAPTIRSDVAVYDLPTTLTADKILDSFADPQTIPVWELP